ncbi:unnamed protein product [Peronospora farinosa]|uniref:Uncharacterized protein n=1 Tax=Peronospora farinosa TaxID=134698 RepID=A0ABN8C978_9STRA|nr:unnamed protein product [Peronospora farinosa]
MQPVQHSAICQVGRDGLELQCLAMNKLEVSAQDPREHRLAMAAAESTSNMPLSASALITHPTGGVNDFSDDGCKVMVNFNGFEPVPVGNPFAFPRFNDGDEDIVNVRSPIICNPSTSNARSASLSPTCVSALARDEVVKSDTDYDEPSWTIQEFKEYLGMLELLQNVSCDAEGGEMCLSANCLGQMERLLTSLLPQGV